MLAEQRRNSDQHQRDAAPAHNELLLAKVKALDETTALKEGFLEFKVDTWSTTEEEQVSPPMAWAGRKWRLQVERGDDGKISAFLNLMQGAPCSVSFKLAVRHRKQNKAAIANGPHVNPFEVGGSSTWGLAEMTTLDALTEAKGYDQEEDALTFGCTFKVEEPGWM